MSGSPAALPQPRARLLRPSPSRAATTRGGRAARSPSPESDLFRGRPFVHQERRPPDLTRALTRCRRCPRSPTTTRRRPRSLPARVRRHRSRSGSRCCAPPHRATAHHPAHPALGGLSYGVSDSSCYFMMRRAEADEAAGEGRQGRQRQEGGDEGQARRQEGGRRWMVNAGERLATASRTDQLNPV
jgi:hypothetical protein